MAEVPIQEGIVELALDQKSDLIEINATARIAMKIFERTAVFMPGNDTYSMAFKSFHNDTSHHLQLSPREVFEATQAVFFVSGIQLSLIFVVFLTITNEEIFSIKMPSTMAVLATRFVCSILMHLQVITDIKQSM